MWYSCLSFVPLQPVRPLKWKSDHVSAVLKPLTGFPFHWVKVRGLAAMHQPYVICYLIPSWASSPTFLPCSLPSATWRSCCSQTCRLRPQGFFICLAPSPYLQGCPQWLSHSSLSNLYSNHTFSRRFFPWHHILNCSLSTSLHFALYFFIVTLYLFTDLFCLLFVFTHNISYGRAGICLFYSLPSPAPRTVPGTYGTLNNYLLNQWTNCGNWTGERELTFSKRNESPESTQ